MQTGSATGRLSATHACGQEEIVLLLARERRSKRKVKISVENEDRKVAIHIQDEGCGIEAEHLERIFERFYRVDKARDRKLGGTGLGLAIVKHIAIIHQGKVEVKSTPEKGSKFSILLPQIPRTEQESETE